MRGLTLPPAPQMHVQPLQHVVFKDMHFQGSGNSFEMNKVLDGLVLWKELWLFKLQEVAILCQYCAVIKNMAFRKLHEDCMELVINCLCLQF